MFFLSMIISWLFLIAVSLYSTSCYFSLWGVLIGFILTIATQGFILWAIKYKILAGDGKVISPRELMSRKKTGSEQWDGKFVVYRSDGKPLDKNARFFLMKYDEENQEPERQALQLYAELIQEQDPDMSEKVKTAVRETKIKE